MAVRKREGESPVSAASSNSDRCSDNSGAAADGGAQSNGVDGRENEREEIMPRFAGLPGFSSLDDEDTGGSGSKMEFGMTLTFNDYGDR